MYTNKSQKFFTLDKIKMKYQIVLSSTATVVEYIILLRTIKHLQNNSVFTHVVQVQEQ